MPLDSYDDNFEMAPPPYDVADLRMPPHSIEAEQSVIGGLLIAPNSFDAIDDLINEKDFYRADHRTTFAAIAKLAEAGKPYDVITVHDALVSSGGIEQAGGIAYLIDLARNTPSAANIRAYATVVRERSLLRGMIAISNDIATAAYDPKGRTAAEILDEAQAALIAMSDSGNAAEQDTHVSSALVGYIEELERRASSNGIVGLATGFEGIDQRTNGLMPGNLIIVGARPKMGKTTFAMNIATNVAIGQNKPTLIFSMEMSRVELLDRMISSIGGVPFSQLRTGRVFNTEYGDLISPTAQRIKSAPLFIDDRAALTVAQMRSAARRQHRKTPLALIVVDYLQLGRAKAESRVMEITAVSQGLKALAKELGCPVIALSQLSRKCEEQKRRPVASDLRDSGSIEQDADGIFLIYRDEVYNENSPLRGTAEIIIPALRNGETGVEYLDGHLAMCRFQNKAGHYVPPNPDKPRQKSAFGDY